MLRKPQVPRDGTWIRPPSRAHNSRQVITLDQQVLSRAHSQGVPRNLRVARSITPLHFDYTTFDDVVNVSVADWAVKEASMVYRAEEWLDIFWF